MEKKPEYLELPSGITAQAVIQTLIKSKRAERARAIEVKENSSYRKQSLRHNITTFKRELAACEKELNQILKAPDRIKEIDVEIKKLQTHLEKIAGKNPGSKKIDDPDQNF